MLAEVDAIEILTNVEQYYKNALTHVLWFLGVAGFIIGFIVPIVVVVVQRALLKRDKQAILRETRKQIEKETRIYKENLKQALKESYKLVNHHSAIHWYEMAEAISRTTGSAWPFAIKYTCYAINSAVEATWAADHAWWPKLRDGLRERMRWASVEKTAQAMGLRPAILSTLAGLEKAEIGGVTSEIADMLGKLVGLGAADG